MPPPDFILLELFAVLDLYRNWKNYPTSESRLKRFQFLETTVKYNDVGSGFNRGCALCTFVGEFARFYRYPLISWREVGYFAFARHYVNNINYTANSWPYSKDGIHLTTDGCRYVIDNMLGPFLKSAFEPRVEATQEELTCVDEEDVCMQEYRSFLRKSCRTSSAHGHRGERT